MTDDGIELAHEIESWNPAGESVLWVKLPTVGATPSTIYLYYGNPSATASSDPPAVWSAGYLAVLHLESLDDTVGGLGAATTGGGPDPAAGLIGGGFSFDGVDGYVEYSTTALGFSDSASYSLGAWVRVDDGLGSFTLLASTLGDPYWGLWKTNGNWRFHDPDESQAAATTDWTYLTLVQTGGEREIWINGARDLSTTSKDGSGADGFFLGGDPRADSFYSEVTLDEVRIRDRAPEPGWIEAQYQSMIGALVTVGAPESR